MDRGGRRYRFAAGVGRRRAGVRRWGWPLGLVVLAGLSGPAAGTVSAAEVHVGLPRLPAELDPGRATTASELTVLRLVFRGLVDVGDRGEIEPGLAAAFSVSRDGTVWSFRLRLDLILHDGSPLGVDDVVAALAERIGAEPPPDTLPAWLRPFQGPDRIVREVRRAEAAPATVEVVLAQPFAPLLAVLAHPGLAVAVPRGDGRRQGTGPYRVVEQAPGRLTLDAVPGAQSKLPPASRLVFHEVADDAAGLAGLAPGGVLHVAAVTVPPAGSAQGLQVVSGPTWRLGLLTLRADRGPTSRKSIRQAMALGLDPALVGPALGGWAVPHAGYLPPGAWGARDASPRTHDLARARRLTAQSGVTDPTVTLVAIQSALGPDPAALADAVRISLASAGIQVRVRVDPAEAPPGALPRSSGELGLVEAALPVNDPHFFLTPLLGSDGGAGAATRFRNPQVEGLLGRASQLGFRPERLRLYQRLQGLLAEEVPFVPLYARLAWLVVRPGVRGARVDPSGVSRLEHLSLDGVP